MRALDEYNPIAIFIFFLSAAGIPMFCWDPALNVLSLVGAVLFWALLSDGNDRKSYLWFFLLFVVMSLLNPLFNHNGVTVLFVINNNPVTLEALYYGMYMSVKVIGVLFWFRSFSKLFTDDRLMYLFGTISPKISLILSMVLRSIPLFKKQSEDVQKMQRSLGLYREENAWDNIRGGLSVFSILVTWGLENGIITADSMSARGYGIGRRTFFSRFRFRRSDAVLIAVVLLFAGVAVWAIVSGVMDYDFYPSPTPWKWDALKVSALAAYAALAFLPAVLETGDRLKWKYLQSEI